MLSTRTTVLAAGILAFTAMGLCAAETSENHGPALPEMLASAPKPRRLVLRPDAVKAYVDAFNASDEGLYRSYIGNTDAWPFLERNVPWFECPDKELEEIYYFRWWTYRKHIKSTPDGFVVTEFLPKVGWSGKHNTISCPAGHHLYEGRWLSDPRYLDNYSVFWFRKGGVERGKDYNHSSYCDLVISGLVGLRPRADETLEVNPLVPENAWDYFCLDGVRYRNHWLTILYDRTGKRYKLGTGLRVFADGQEIAASEKLSRLTVSLAGVAPLPEAASGQPDHPTGLGLLGPRCVLQAIGRLRWREVAPLVQRPARPFRADRRRLPRRRGPGISCRNKRSSLSERRGLRPACLTSWTAGLHLLNVAGAQRRSRTPAACLRAPS